MHLMRHTSRQKRLALYQKKEMKSVDLLHRLLRPFQKRIVAIILPTLRTQ